MSPPKLVDQVLTAIRLKHYSLRTEEAYWHWIRRFILFHNKRHPNEMAEAEISAFLSHLAVDLSVSASTQNQALSALHFCAEGSLRSRRRRLAPDEAKRSPGGPMRAQALEEGGGQQSMGKLASAARRPASI